MVVVVFVAGFASLIPKAQASAINTASKIDVNPGTQYSTFKGVPVYRLHVANTGDALDTITQLSLTPSGSVDDTKITLHFFKDANDNGIVDQGDTNLLASAAFGSNDTIQTFNITDVPVAALATASILITADGASLADTNLFNLAFVSNTDIGMATVAVAVGGFPKVNGDSLTPLTVRTNIIPSLTIIDGTNDPVAKTVTASQTGVVVKQLSITETAGRPDSIVSLAITPTGTENDAVNVSATKFYIDLGTPGVIDGNGSDILLIKSPTTYSLNDTKQIFTFASPIPIALSSTVKILYTYDLGAGVVGGNTLRAQLTTGDAITGSGAVVTNNSLISALITIGTPPTLTQPTVVSASTVRASSAPKVIGAFAVTENGGISDTIDQFTIENKTALTATTADIASVAIYSDNGTLGIIDGTDSVACAQATTNTTTNFDAGGSVINFTCLTPIVIGSHATQNYLAVITTTAGATDERTMSAKVNAHLVTAGAWAASDLQTTNPITIDVVAPTTPIATPLAGAYTSAQSVVLSSTGFTSIRFTADGTSIGNCSSGSLYSDAISVSSSETIGALGCDDAGNISPLGTFVYTINSLSPVLYGSHPRVYNTNLYNTVAATILQNIPQKISVTTFGRTLNTGMTSGDIKTLQQYLNNHGFILASSGPGSPGQETTYFGSLTKGALIKFQEAHKDKILTPLGLIKGTGYFGQSTKAFVNEL